MCLILDEKTRVKIAKEDIKVFKILSPQLRSIFYGGFQYEKGKLYETEILPSTQRVWSAFADTDEHYLTSKYGNFRYNRTGLKAFGQGFHSSLNKENIEEVIKSSDKRLFNATIPKGARYYVGGTGLVISNKIIVH